MGRAGETTTSSFINVAGGEQQATDEGERYTVCREKQRR
jgi:hypothetical protein